MLLLSPIISDTHRENADAFSGTSIKLQLLLGYSCCLGGSTEKKIERNLIHMYASGSLRQPKARASKSKSSFWKSQVALVTGDLLLLQGTSDDSHVLSKVPEAWTRSFSPSVQAPLDPYLRLPRSAQRVPLAIAITDPDRTNDWPGTEPRPSSTAALDRHLRCSSQLGGWRLHSAGFVDSSGSCDSPFGLAGRP